MENKNDNNNVLSAEQIAALFETQEAPETDSIPVEEAVVNEPLAKAEANSLLSAEQIAALFEAQEAPDADSIVVEEAVVNEPLAKAEANSDSNGLLSAEQIAALFETQEAPEIDSIPVEEAVVNEPLVKAEANSDSNGLLSAEQIAALFEAQGEPEADTKAIEEAVVDELSVKAEANSDSNGLLSAEQIAALFEAQGEPEADTTPVEEAVVNEPLAKAEANSDSNGLLSAEQIAALFEAQGEPEADTKAIEEAVVDELSVKAESNADSNGLLSAEQIAALFEAQGEPEADTTPVEEAVDSETKAETSADSNGLLTAEQIAALFESQEEPEADNTPVEKAVDSETKAETSADSNGLLSAEQIAALFEAQGEPEVDTTPVKEAVVNEPLVKAEANSDSNGLLSAEQIAALFETQEAPDADSIPVEEAVDSEALTNTESDLEDVAVSTMPSPKVKLSIIKYFGLFIKTLLSTLSRLKPSRKKEHRNLTDLSPNTEEIVSDSNDTSITTPTQLMNEAEVPEDNSSIPENSIKGRKTKKQKRPKSEETQDKYSKSKTLVFALVIRVLLTTSFAAGYFSRDLVSALKPDPAKTAILNDEKAKLAEQKAKDAANAKRAKELANINPKDYTSSMYLESLILKGQAENKTSIKLNKIDDVKLLSQFPKLRRIRLQDMTGNEDLSIIENLTAVEEILIENSILKNQFSSGSFNSVKYLELNECTIEGSKQFSNFKKATELYVDSTKFVSKDGNIEIAAYMPALESLTLTNCGEYIELVGAGTLTSLKELKVSDNTIIKNTSYTQNQKIEKLTVDISFVKSADQLMALSSLQNLKVLIVEVGSSPLSRSDLITTLNRISSEHPELSIEITGAR